MNSYYVYEWIRLDTNEPFYIGKGKNDRWKILNRGNNKHFNNIVDSIPIAVSILHDNLDEDVAYGLECYYIWLYRDIIGYNLTNITDGGEGVTLCGENNPMYGKTHSEESKKKMSEAHKNISDETRRKMSEANKGRTHSKEAKEKISRASKGRKCSEKTRENMSMGAKRMIQEKGNNRRKSVICLTTKRIFCSAKEAGEYYCVDSSGIIRCCNKNKNYKYSGKYKGKKLKWKYLVWKHNKKYRIKK